MRLITLLTDFGTADGYVGAMKGVLASLAPDAPLVDVAHDLARGDVEHARWVLGRYWNRFPPGTVHLVVVDPGVGTERRALAAELDGRFLVAPDNGVASRVLDQAGRWTAVEVGVSGLLPEPSSRTFHGRDLFAPAAARLAAGTSLEELGRPLTDPVRIEEPVPKRSAQGDLLGEIVSVDRFGNLVTNLPEALLQASDVVEVQGRRLAPGETYGDVEPGDVLALVNSDGRLEVAVRDGSAAEVLGLARGAEIWVRRGTEAPGAPS